MNTPDGHGIVSKDDLKIKGGNLSVTAGRKALSANDTLTVEDGILSLNAGTEGMEATYVPSASPEARSCQRSAGDRIPNQMMGMGGFGGMGRGGMTESYGRQFNNEEVGSDGSSLNHGQADRQKRRLKRPAVDRPEGIGGMKPEVAQSRTR